MSPDILQARRRLGLPLRTDADEEFYFALRDFQGEHGLPVTGDLDAATAAMLEAGPTSGLVPLWFGREDQPVVVATRIGVGPEAVRRFQSARGLPCTGLVDEATAIALGD